ncbi:MAG: hypothetical protein PHN41_07440, partial [Bacteroidales bacterium]|nr:hypothetical protein [Bacteroidales bacterium]
LLAENLPIGVDQLDKLLEFAYKNKIDLTVVGPEQLNLIHSMTRSMDAVITLATCTHLIIMWIIFFLNLETYPMKLMFYLQT